MNEITALDWALQILGTVGSCAGIWLCRKKKIVCWPVWMVGNIFWIWVYLRTNLLFAIITMFVYQILNGMSWWEWYKDKKKGETR